MIRRVLFLLLIAAPVCAQCPEFEEASPTGIVQSGQLDEISGVAASRQTPGVLWVHNDSGDNSRVYAIDLAGKLLGTYVLNGIFVDDGEDISIGPGPEPGIDYLYFADTGDNNQVRPSVNVFRFPEPKVDLSQDNIRVFVDGVETINLTYPDGARDAETILIDPLRRDLYLITKREPRSRIYLAGWPQSTTQTITMEFVGALRSGFSTGGDVSPDGTEVLIRSYPTAYWYERDPLSPLWQSLTVLACNVPLASEPQGEAIGFDAEGRDYFTISEGEDQPINRYKRVPPTSIPPSVLVH